VQIMTCPILCDPAGSKGLQGLQLSTVEWLWIA
jgi:hypothetical protein